MEEILSGLPAPMQLNETVFIIAAIFLLLLFILNKLIFQPLVAILDERHAKVKEGALARENAQKTVEESQAQYQLALINERRKAQAGRLAVLEKVEAERERIIAAARQEAAALVEKSNAETERQVAAAKAALEGETKAIADRIVNAVLSRSA